MADYDKSEMEKAEGSRDNANLSGSDVNRGSATDSPMERGAGQESQPHKPIEGTGEGRQPAEGHDVEGSAQTAAGITNRPAEEEERNQAELPARGERKGG